MLEISKEAAERFWTRVDKSSGAGGCWLWTGALQSGGYGTTTLDRVQWMTHRAAVTITFGPIPKGKIVCHSCDVRHCVNPAHLFVGTQEDNIRDMLRKKRGAGRDGHGANTKLTPEIVREIRKRYRPRKWGLVRDLAKEFGLSTRQIHSIVKREQWAWLT